ncbi:MAG: hypothetical protein ACR2LI_07350 [Propionibacteriaceae bacterium]
MGVMVAAAPALRRDRIWRQVARDLRWSFTPPWTWLSGVAVNLLLSIGYVVIAPLTARPHHDWAILVGSYFAVFILADVTTTNVLGADAYRVRLALLRGVRLRRILLVKNLTLMIIVGMPTLIATAAITVGSEADYRLILTLPGVVFPILTWLGLGNLVSVTYPVAAVPLRRRWEQRRQLRRTVRWLVALVLPYVLVLGEEPFEDLPKVVLAHLPYLPHTARTAGMVLLACGVGCYVLGTAIALVVARTRKVRFDDLT